jgi:hypothetical protein
VSGNATALELTCRLLGPIVGDKAIYQQQSSCRAELISLGQHIGNLELSLWGFYIREQLAFSTHSYP